jgi:predicted ribonuclease YlaK
VLIKLHVGTGLGPTKLIFIFIVKKKRGTRPEVTVTNDIEIRIRPSNSSVTANGYQKHTRVIYITADMK